MSFLYLLAFGVYWLLNTYLTLVIVDIILSWFPMLHRFRIVRLIDRVTDAYMGLFHGFLTIGFLDFTPIIAIAIYEGLLQAYGILLNWVA